VDLAVWEHGFLSHGTGLLLCLEGTGGFLIPSLALLQAGLHLASTSDTTRLAIYVVESFDTLQGGAYGFVEGLERLGSSEIPVICTNSGDHDASTVYDALVLALWHVNIEVLVEAAA